MKTLALIIFILITSQIAYSQCSYTVTVTDESCYCTCAGGVTIDVVGGIPPYVIDLDGVIDTFYSTYVRTSLCSCFSPYTFTIIDQGSCLLIDSFDVALLASPQVTIYTSAVNCSGCCNGVGLINVSGGIPPFNYWWQGVSNFNLALQTDLCPGSYHVVVQDSLLCQFDTTIIIYIDSTAFNLVEGRLYCDVNSNGMFDTLEPPLINSWITISPLTEIALSDQNGHYQKLLSDSFYIVAPVVPYGWHISSAPVSYSINLSGSNISNLDFGFYPDSPYCELSANLFSGLPRCNNNVLYQVTVSNLKILSCDSIAITMYFDSAMSFVNAIPIQNNFSGNSISWALNGLSAFQSQTVNATFTMPGPGVQVTAYIVVVGFDSTGNVLASTVDTLINTVTCSFDPNDLMVNPPGLLAQHYISPEQELEYTIRFQNTGSDTAFNISILDMLDQSLDMSTFEIVSSSHLVQTEIRESGLLRFNFNNILLPDSNIDELGSHGYVSYIIKPKINLLTPTVVNNTAYIFFDQNLPIATNSIFNTIHNTIPTKVLEIKNTLFSFDLYPNPAENYVTFEFDKLDQRSEIISIKDISGREIISIKRNRKENVTIPLFGIRSGIYFVSVLVDSNTPVSTKMLVVQ